MEDSMIERVATAIIGEIARQMRAGESCALGDNPRKIARAAMEAMREPTEAQYEALSATNKTWRELTSRLVWQTYIDAALSAQHGDEQAK
jgi:hypothetical protein